MPSRRTGLRVFPTIPRAVLGLLLLLAAAAASGAVWTVAAAAPGSECDPVEGYRLAHGEDYRGRVSTTVSGLVCQNWMSQSPHAHPTDLLPAKGFGDHNYCRYIGGEDGPGCYTTDPNVIFERCSVGAPCADSDGTLGQERAITFQPPTGTTMVGDSRHNAVSLTCYPSPCLLYYSLTAQVPTAAKGTLYREPFFVRDNTTVKALAVFSGGAQVLRLAKYTVLPPPPPTSSAVFIPSDGLTYTNPVNVFIQGVTAADSVMIYRDDELVGAPYTGNIWLNRSTRLTAVINSATIVSAYYSLQITVPPVYVYPNSGTFVGGVSVLVYQSTEPATYFRSINGSAMVEMNTASMLFSLVTPGRATVTVKMVTLGGVESFATTEYNILAATPAVLSPPVEAVYNHAITVECRDPLGKALIVVPGNPGEYERTLSLPGSYTISCSYKDNLQREHVTTGVYALKAKPLPAPAFAPACGTVFPFTALSLGVSVVPPAPIPGAGTSGGDPARFGIRGDVGGVGRLEFLMRVDDPEAANRQYTYGVMPSGPGAVVATMASYSSDPLEDDSAATSCSYTVTAIGDVATPLFAARPLCYSFQRRGDVVSDACAELVRLQLARCLHLYTTELIDVRPIGPFATVRLTGLTADLAQEMYGRAGGCLTDPAAVEVRSVTNETSGALTLATAWELLLPQMEPAADAEPWVYTDSAFLVRVGGVGVQDLLYRFVREEFSCDDIGHPVFATIPAGAAATSFAATAGLSGAQAARALRSAADETHSRSASVRGADFDAAPGSDEKLLVFHIDVPGEYKLCSILGDGTAYVVPPLNETLRVATRPSTPTLRAAETMPCGGLVDTAFMSDPIPISFTASPPELYYDYTYSLNAGDAWYHGRLGTSVVLRGVDSRTQPAQVIAASLGLESGTALTCVFYPPAVHPTEVSAAHYRFSRAALQMGGGIADAPRNAAVVLTVEGLFQSRDLVLLAVHAPDGVTLASDGLEHTTTTTATVVAHLNRTLPDALLRLPASVLFEPYNVTASVDGVAAVPLAPAADGVALSPFALLMEPCATSVCASGYQFNSSCVCIGIHNRSAYLCHSGGSHPSTNGSNRLVLMLVYLLLLIAIGAAIYFAARRGGKRNTLSDGAGATDITIVADTEPAERPAAAAATACDSDRQQQSPP